MKTLTWEFLPALLGAFAIGGVALAADGATKDEAVAMVKKAVSRFSTIETKSAA